MCGRMTPGEGPAGGERTSGRCAGGRLPPDQRGLGTEAKVITTLSCTDSRQAGRGIYK